MPSALQQLVYNFKVSIIHPVRCGLYTSAVYKQGIKGKNLDPTFRTWNKELSELSHVVQGFIVCLCILHLDHIERQGWSK